MLKLFLLLFPIFVQAAPSSDHFDGKKFFNPERNIQHTTWDIFLWKLSGSASDWPKEVPNKNWPYVQLGPQNKAVVTFINHATFLLQLKGLTILTDPIFSERASRFRFIGPKRVRRPGLMIEDLPAIDVVVISHNHYDHLDLESLKILDGRYKPLFLVPLKDEKLLKEAGIQNVKEMDWWEELEIKGIKITFTPAQHWSARGIFDKRDSLWGSFFIAAPEIKIYFCGDTGYSSHFKKIREKLGAPDLSLLPIGAYAPREIMEVSHMTPEESVKAHQDLESKLSIGMHFGTFQLTDEPIDGPVKRLEKISTENFVVLDQGESKTF